MTQNQRGFTLVEIAIVLIIIGLLLGGALKGQELITQARIKSVAADFSNITVAIYGYQDRYRKLPGDDDLADSRWTSPQAGKGNGNGSLDDGSVASILNCAADTAKDSENCKLWQHLRLSGFVAGDPSSKIAPQNSAGGLLQVQNGALGNNGLTICSSGLSGKIAGAIDTLLDDGKPGTGAVRGSDKAAELSTKLADSAVYSEDSTAVYVVCKSL
ncbi:prepilin-type N-terminal cleavage/methylation domain-containing protein [Dechloromonas denitrificans]|uniref:prepilin-type N-terminal cleavage/methylation domain-containing protein n=1 Tax=Dechloromonas denitrificans TaxID=281362 RepID=UPI001CF8D652|nr:prepilin-type N-terminal cleavage/methylation domain-containing protein [Dechloromonas denitrificans]UCV11046.1 prepilin-type N-terminal cleavage/methylation domain-containing protein [Dechloromonas denitrificans]